MFLESTIREHTPTYLHTPTGLNRRYCKGKLYHAIPLMKADINFNTLVKRNVKFTQTFGNDCKNTFYF